jgi:maleamate amidohydrolase
MAGWDRFLTERDKAVFDASGYGRRGGLGKRPVLLVVDVSYGFCGDRPEPVLESIKRWHNSCGEVAWEGIAAIRELLDAARAKRLPVIYSTGVNLRPDGFDSGRWADKNPRQYEADPRENDIVDEIAPTDVDIVIPKYKPSVFFGTALASYLTDLQADSVIVCGTTTSGCVRATVVDAFSLNYRVAVVEEGTFDRGEASHWINLSDMDRKYADVMPLLDVLDVIEALPAGLFDDRMPALATASVVAAHE